ncbi:MAG: MoaD/ThiS family protein [Desulfobacteraceae bacterium]|jgi:molybdopterin converting factor small subunit|nr:MoaD/ThiS family protein [Desulfobacteraceae bacterium]
MKVALKCFATLANHNTCDFDDGTAYELEDGQTAGDLIQLAGINVKDVTMIFLNSRVVGIDTVLSEGDRVALTPATAGLKKPSTFAL